MSTFNLPDLGEGLPDAEIHEWHVKVGDNVELDQPLVSMETAKAVVEVPAPQQGKITKLHGKIGDIIQTGAPLVEFENGAKDEGTVVGKIETSNETVKETFRIGAKKSSTHPQVKVTPALRQLARKLEVDLARVNGTGSNGLITRADIETAAKQATTPPEGYEALRGPRRAMSQTMSASHAEVVPVTIFEDADIHHFTEETDITVRIIQAICGAIKEDNALNAWYDSKSMSRKCSQEVNLGLAIDTGEDLIVPVIKSAQKCDENTLRKTIDSYKQSATHRTLEPDTLHGATISLSNFGNFCGRYASPIIVPPMVAILGVGRYRDEVVAHQGNIEIHRVLPLSLTFDHRAVTGGEATRFLAYIIKELRT